MEIICPKCEFRQDVPDEKIPPKAEKATCPKCGAKFKFRNLGEKDEFTLEDEPLTEEQASARPEPVQEPVQGGQEQDDSIWARLENMGQEEGEQEKFSSAGNTSQTQEVPWENLDGYGFFPGFVETIKRAMLMPALFFQKMPMNGLSRPLAFFLLISVIQAFITFVWQMSGIFPVTAEHGAEGIGIGAMGIGSILIVLIYPLFMGLWLFLGAGITHLFLMLFQSARAGYQGTFRALAYGNAPMILGIVPFIGPVMGAAWSIGVTIVAYKQIHQTTYPRVILSLLTPLVLVLALGAIMY